MRQSEERFITGLAADMCDYMDDIKARHQMLLTVHQLDAKVSACWYRFLPYNLHQSIFCLTVKDCSEAWQHCIDCQSRVRQRADERGAYVGVCWAGMREAIFPLCDCAGHVLAFLSVSGYAAPGDQALPRIRRACSLYGVNYDQLLAAYGSLDPSPPDMARLARILAPLRHMFTLLVDQYAKLTDAQPDETPTGQYQRITAYISRYFTKPITLEDMAKLCHCSYSYVSHLFQHFGDETFSQFLARTRIEAAQKYLEYSNQSIREIASAVGYDDPNYFSFAFRRLTGTSPTAWRADSRAQALKTGEGQ